MEDVVGSETNSDLNSQELFERAREAISENTRKTTEWAVHTYRRWAERRQNIQYVRVNVLDYGDDLVSLDRALLILWRSAYNRRA